MLINTDDVIHAHNLPPSLQTDGTTGTGTRGDLQVQLDNPSARWCSTRSSRRAT